MNEKEFNSSLTAVYEYIFTVHIYFYLYNKGVYKS